MAADLSHHATRQTVGTALLMVSFRTISGRISYAEICAVQGEMGGIKEARGGLGHVAHCISKGEMGTIKEARGGRSSAIHLIIL